MLTQPTIDKLKGMRLDNIAAAWLAQQKDPEITALSFDERFGMLIDAEWIARENKRLTRALSEAKLKLSTACIEDIDYAARRELDKAFIKQLATCRWIEEQHNVVITGATGTGKTYIACALAQQACRKGYRAAYRRATRLSDELILARADGSHATALKRYTRIDVLVIDDWGMAPLKDQDRRDLYELLDDRHGAKSTIITSQLPTAQWHDYVGDPMVADAVCDRVLHNSHRIVLKGPSRRKEDSNPNS